MLLRRGKRALGIGRVLLVLCAGIAAVPLSIEFAARHRGPVMLDRVMATSPLLIGAQGAWVDATLSADEKWRFNAGVNDVPQLYLDLLLAYEDHRFFEHGGVSYRAVVRAAVSSLRKGRIVSGASTLPMQVARLIEGQSPGLRGKIAQAVAARRLVLDHSRDEILAYYLTLAPFGGNLEGVEAAALHYFGKRARDLSPDQAALLVAIPQAPEARRLDRHPDTAGVARARVLAKAATSGVISAAQAAELAGKPVSVQPARRFGRSHTILAAFQRRDATATAYASTLRADLQMLVQRDLQAALADKPDAVNGAALVIRNRDGAVLAHVGNARSYDSPAGYLDLTTRTRSPGSALKPFVYGMAFDAGLAHPQTIFHDRPQRYGAFSPRNFGDSPFAPIPLREALASSLNSAAVAVMQEVGPQRFVDHMRHVGTKLALPQSNEAPGLAVSLGGVGISLTDLARLYVALANEGKVVDLTLQPGAAPEPDARRLFGAGATWAVTDALAGARPPEGEVMLRSTNGAMRVAYKTGTSSGRRDVWAIGYDRLHTVAVWIGRPDNGGMPGAAGRITAAPVLWSIFGGLPVPSQGVIRPLSARDQHLGWDTPPARLKELGSDAGGVPLAIQFPQSTGVVKRAVGAEKVTLSLSGGTPPYSWIVNDILHPARLSQSLTLSVDTGPLTITVLDSTGARDTLETWVE